MNHPLVGMNEGGRLLLPFERQADQIGAGEIFVFIFQIDIREFLFNVLPDFWSGREEFFVVDRPVFFDRKRELYDSAKVFLA